MIQKTFSISERYKNDVLKILEELPKREQSRFICQALIEKARKFKSLANYEEDIEPVIKNEVEANTFHSENKEPVMSKEPINALDMSNPLISTVLYVVGKNQSILQEDPTVFTKIMSNDLNTINGILMKNGALVAEFYSMSQPQGIVNQSVNEKTVTIENHEHVRDTTLSSEKKNNGLKNRINNW